MECKNLIKINNMLHMVDSNNYELNIEDHTNMSEYENKYDLKVENIITEFIKTKDKDFDNIITDIKKLVEKHNVDYYIYGDEKAVAMDKVAVYYNLENRNYEISCYLKVFYDEGLERTSHMISFHSGTHGNKFGFEFYRYFNFNDYCTDIKPMLEKYFSDSEDGINDIFIMDKCCSNILNNIKNKYSEE